ncbi:uracil-DNA glycosylase [Fluviicola sp.]|jgi:uracil-DNA glycosylase|uniref:uracil-DNA glycosylase n=1 Tax=Fluviicola sp. TaxID=1917219 RepID=UPI00281F0D0B|nr:uracil-DNA glycosylase [Fluviicola sp.]MDR0801817.1 uracil-DNA glycosylase [Fluviicola sp.]
MKVSIDPSWEKALQKSFDAPYFKNLVHFVKQEYHQFPSQVFPEGKYLFRAFDSCPFDQLKVVILGQDPYPTRGHAHGLCFSCDAHVRPLPKSLQNIFKELEDDLGIKAPANGDLNHWANQGVLLLNSLLTVREGQPLSHANRGWEKFTDEVIEAINNEREGIIFVLWGSPAQAKASRVDTNKHIILKAPHPSPLSAHRGFFGSKPFSKINEILVRQGKDPIKWA